MDVKHEVGNEFLASADLPNVARVDGFGVEEGDLPGEVLLPALLALHNLGLLRLGPLLGLLGGVDIPVEVVLAEDPLHLGLPQPEVALLLEGVEKEFQAPLEYQLIVLLEALQLGLGLEDVDLLDDALEVLRFEKFAGIRIFFSYLRLMQNFLFRRELRT